RHARPGAPGLSALRPRGRSAGGREARSVFADIGGVRLGGGGPRHGRAHARWTDPGAVLGRSGDELRSRPNTREGWFTVPANARADHGGARLLLLPTYAILLPTRGQSAQPRAQNPVAQRFLKVCTGRIR